VSKTAAVFNKSYSFFETITDLNTQLEQRSSSDVNNSTPHKILLGLGGIRALIILSSISALSTLLLN
jgi:hypothetical protein